MRPIWIRYSAYIPCTRSWISTSYKHSLDILLIKYFKAMSAIEIMDPKMDSGINTNLTPLTFETAAQSGHLPLTDITPEQFLGTFFLEAQLLPY